jgi:hypothetical protein
MGAELSKLGQQQRMQKNILMKQTMNNFSKKKNFTQLLIPRIIDLQYILDNRPNPVEIIQQKQFNKNINLQIAEKILEYNKKIWNFGNKKTPNSNEKYHKLMNEETYKIFLNFVQSKLVSINNRKFNNNSYLKEVTGIIGKIGEIRKIGLPNINEFFTIKLSSLFPEIKGFNDKTDIINVTLLGLAAIIGAEHLVIYFLMCGANPNITYSSENKDTGTLMLTYQIALTKIDAPTNYFIILARLLYILFLLGSVGAGIDLSNIYKTNYTIFKKNQGFTEIQESILHQLVRMPYVKIDLSNNDSLIYLNMQTGASIPLLLKILEKNNISNGIKFLKLFSNIDSRDIPFGYTILYCLLLNESIESKIKLSLVYYIIKLGANPLIIPDIRQNSRIKTSMFVKQNQTEIQLLFALLQDSNSRILPDLLNILSINPEFNNIYKEFIISKPNLNQNKNYTIQHLYQNNERLRKILAEVSKQKAIQTESAIIESELLGAIMKNNTMRILGTPPEKN